MGKTRSISTNVSPKRQGQGMGLADVGIVRAFLFLNTRRNFTNGCRHYYFFYTRDRGFEPLSRSDFEANKDQFIIGAF